MKTIPPDDPEPLRLRRPLFHPSRWPVAAGLAMVAVGAFAPWQVMVDPMGFREVINGVSGGDALGLQVLLFAGATALICALPGVAGTRTRTVQLLPVLTAAATLILAIRSYLAVAPKGAWDASQTSQVVVDWGLWLLLAGSAMIALGGLATTLTIIRDRPLSPEPWEPRADLSFVRPLVSVLAGFVLALAGAEVFGSLRPSNMLLAVPVLFAGTVVATFCVYGLLGFVLEAATARRPGRSPGTGLDLPDLEPVRRKRGR